MRGRILLWLLILIGACATNKKLPDWTLTEPVDPQYYSAVVQVSKSDPDYRDRAFDAALRKISLQISVQVEASVSLKETESYGVPGSEFSSWVQASSRTQLKDVQLLISYETKRDYWAWYRLSKEQYLMQRARQRDMAVSSALDLLGKYDASGTDPAVGIPYLLAAIDNLADYLDMDLNAMHQGQSVNVYVELLSRLRNIPQAISITLDKSTLNAVARRKMDDLIKVTVTSNTTGTVKPISRFPLRCEFTRGKGEITVSAVTGDDGTGELRLKRVTDYLPDQSVSVTVDKGFFLAQAESVPSRKLFSALAFQPAVLNLRVSKPSISVSTSFAGNPSIKHSYLLEDKLRQLNLDVKDASAKSDYSLQLSIAPKPGSLIPALHVFASMADAQLLIRDNQTGAVISSESVVNIKATGKTIALAEANTELIVVKLFCDEYLFRIVNSTILQGD
jgi:hypothetical protein